MKLEVGKIGRENTKFEIPEQAQSARSFLKCKYLLKEY